MMPSHQRLSPVDKILRRFYEPLVLLRVLDPSRDVIKPDLISDRGLNEQAKLLRDFLDQSSFLCDSVKGGDTVTAIATQKTFEQPVFWLASNSSSYGKARDHYGWILSRLERLCDPDVADSEIENDIFTRSIVFSTKRIKAYVDWLKAATQQAKDQKKESMTAEDELVFRTLQELQSRAHDYHDLCSFAYTCRLDQSIRILSNRHNAQDHRNVWSDIRHLIGRLGMWTKAVKTLVRGARRFPHYIENAKIEVIRPIAKASTPNADHLTDLPGVLHRMLPTREQTSIEMLTKALTELDVVAEVWQSFRQTYLDIKPRPHAELLVLEKFHHDEFDFLNEDRYIGCSKPSCYCCHLYIQHHPGRFSPRPCHGNLWLNWAPPIPLPSGGDSQVKGKTAMRSQDHHSFKMLQEMLVPIRQDLQEQILSRRPRRQKMPDSTTGISSIAYASQQILQSVELSSLNIQFTGSASLRRTSSEAGSTDGSSIQLPGDLEGITPTLLPVDLEERSQRFDANEEEAEEEEGEEEEEDVLVFRGRRLGPV